MTVTDSFCLKPVAFSKDGRPLYTKEQVEHSTTRVLGADNLMGAEVFVGKYSMKSKQDGLYYDLNPIRLYLERIFPQFVPKMMERTGKSYDECFQQICEDFLLPCTPEEAEFTGEKWKLGRILLQGSPTAAIGNFEQYMSASNCFVIDPPKDSYASIFRADSEIGNIMKRRGGVGVDVSGLRPKNTPVQNAAGSSTGAVSFMHRFSNTTREVGQDGRRGALLISLSCHHPDIMQFLTVKNDNVSVTGANISVWWSNEFMEALQNDAEYELRFPVEAGLPDDQYLVRTKISAAEVWQTFVNSAWSRAEPGCLFEDNGRTYTPSDAYGNDTYVVTITHPVTGERQPISVTFRTSTTNPCGEILLSPNDSCRLMVLNLIKFVDKPFTPEASFNYELFEKFAYKAQEYMDMLVDIEIDLVDRILQKVAADPEPLVERQPEILLWMKIKAAAIAGRRTGLGNTAVGDALAMLGIRYGSDESINTVEQIYATLNRGSYCASIDMAEKFGAFPAYNREAEWDHAFLQRVRGNLPTEYIEKWRTFGRRNIANLTTAPVGTISLVFTDSTSGIEPLFTLDSYTRRRKINPSDKDLNLSVDFVDEVGDSWHEYRVFHNPLRLWMEATGKTDPKDSPYFGATAQDQDWVQGVRLQAAAQKWVCHAISRTANLPHDVQVNVVDEIYRAAWQSGCKGYTVYRDGSRSGVLITDTPKHVENVFAPIDAPKRFEDLPADIHRVRIKGDEWTVVVGFYEDRPYEVFAGMDDLGIDTSEFPDGGYGTIRATVRKHPRKNDGARYSIIMNEKRVANIAKAFDDPEGSIITRFVSLALRHRTPIQFVVEQLGRDKDSDFTSFNRVLARVLKHYIPDGAKASNSESGNCADGSNCEFVYQEGCLTCKKCGYSKCG